VFGVFEMITIESDRHGMRNSPAATLLLTTICALILSGILVAGLWPFRSPKNEVTWLSSGSGLRLGDYGSLFSAGGFNTSNSTDRASLEIWLEPSIIDDSGTILSFYPAGRRSSSFALRQSLDDVALLRKNLSKTRSTRSVRIYADHVFHHGQLVFLTISSGEQGTSIYVNGRLVRTSRDFRFFDQDLTGQLVIGNSAETTDTWSGQLKGLAIYDQELTTGRVTEHYQSWLGRGRPVVSAPDRAVALYLFNEGTGEIVRNQVDAATDLVIPERFFVLHEPFLEPPWNEYYPGWHYWKDIGVNIAGFIPLGFFFCAYFSLVRRVEHPIALIIALGFAVSLTIEVLQAFLPTRNSGTTDLITNTFGTATGAILCVRAIKQGWFPRLGISVCPSIDGRIEDLQLEVSNPTRVERSESICQSN
jgi:hypothetical protein